MAHRVRRFEVVGTVIVACLMLLESGCGGARPPRRPINVARYSAIDPAPARADGLAARIVGATSADSGLYLDVLVDGAGPDVRRCANNLGFRVSWMDAKAPVTEVELERSDGAPIRLRRALPVTGFYPAPPYIGPPESAELGEEVGRHRVIQRFMFRTPGTLPDGEYRVRLTEAFGRPVYASEPEFAAVMDWFVFRMPFEATENAGPRR